LKILVITLMFVSLAFAQTVDCTKVFEERKGELLKEIEKIDEAKQSFEALKAATNSLFDRQEAKLDKQRDDLNATMRKLASREENLQKMIEENEKLIKKISGLKSDKISDTYSKMKDSAAASILEEMSIDEASSVLFTLQAKKVSKIMAKMEPKKASQITQRLIVGPPFK